MKKKMFIQLVLTVFIIGFGAWGMYALTASKPEIEMRRQAAPVPRVRVVVASVGSQPIMIHGEGTVQPLREISLVPQVGGKVIYVSPALVNGGQFREGESLLKIDPEDYELAVTLAKAKVKDSESSLKLAKEEAAAAKEEWRLLNEGTPKAERSPPPLVAKEPQLEAAQAQLAADRADLKKAMLNLTRTELKAPFDGRVSSENVDVGQYVSPGQSLGTVYATEAAEIVVPLESEDLYWINVPGFTNGGGPGSKALVQTRLAGQLRTWKGSVVRAQGEIDERTRMINVIVRVESPYATRPPLAVGLFVSVQIEGKVLQAAAIPRAAMHEKDTLWVVDDEGSLRFRHVDVAHIQGDSVIVTKGIANGDRIVLTPLRAVTDGMQVRAEIEGHEEQS